VDVYHQLREAIVDGTLPASAPLTELALAAQYNVSRTPVREALRRLEQDGLVERGARGMQVRGRSPEEILEIYEVRITLEAAAARAAAERRTDLDLLKLEQVHAAMLAASTDDPERLATTNRKFHEAIWAMSHNATLIDLLGRLHAHLIRYRETIGAALPGWQNHSPGGGDWSECADPRRGREVMLSSGRTASGQMLLLLNVVLHPDPGCT